MGEFWRFFKEMGSGTYLLALACTLGLVPVLAARLDLLPVRVVYAVEIWRVATFPFATRSILDLLFQWIFLVLWAMPLERIHGTINLILRLNFLALIVCCAYMVAFFMLRWAAPQVSLTVGTSGLFPLFFTELCADALKNPWQPTYFMFFPCPIPKVFMPAIFLLLDILMGQGVLRNAPCLISGLVCFWWPKVLATLPAHLLKRPESALMVLNGRLGTFYALNSLTELEKKPTFFTGGETRLGGNAMSEEQRREQWAQRYANEASNDVEQPRPSSAEAPLVAKP